MANHKPHILILPLILIFTTIVTALVYLKISLPQLACWDEAGFIWVGYQVSQAIRAGDWQAFFQLSRGQFYYPFFQSWYLGFATLPFGYSINTARLASLGLLLPTIILVYWLGRSLDKKGGLLVALFPVFLTLTSPLVLFFYSIALKESLGLVLTLSSLWLYIISRQSGKKWLFFLTGLNCLILILTKYNYGVLVVGALAVESLLWFSLKTNIVLFLPVGVGMFWWLSPQGYLKWFLTILENKFQYNYYDTTPLGHLLYYPLEMAFGYTFSWLVFLLLAVGFIRALRDWRDFKIRLLSILFLVNFALAERHMANNQARYIFTTVPLFFLVSSYGLRDLFFRLKKVFSRPYSLGFLLPFLLIGTALILRDFLVFPKMIRPTGSHQIGLPAFYEQDFNVVDRYNFFRDLWPKIPPPKNAEKIEDVFGFILENVDLSKKISLVGSINEFSPGLFDYYIAKEREKRGITPRQNIYNEFIVAFTVKPGSRFETKDYRLFTGPSARSARWELNNPGVVLLEKEEFTYLGIVVEIFGKT